MVINEGGGLRELAHVMNKKLHLKGNRSMTKTIQIRKVVGTIILSFILAVCLPSQEAVGQDEGGFESPPVFPVDQVLPAEMIQGPGFKVVETANAEGMLYSFSVWSAYGWYRPQSLDMLRIRIAEIKALNTLSALQKEPLFLQGVSEQVGGTIQQTGRALTRPVSTIREIPLGLQKFGKRIKDSGSQEKTSGELGIHRGAKMQLAQQLGVDPYSDNRQLQEALYSVASNKNRGKLVARVGAMAIPGGAGMAVSAAQLNKSLQEGLYTLSPADLRKATRIKLARVGCAQGDIDVFLSNPGYTLTQQMAIADALSGLAEVNGIGQYLRCIQDAPQPEAALFYQRRVQIALKFHREVRPLKEMVLFKNTPVFIDQGDRMVATVSLDYLYWNQDIAQRLQDLIDGTGHAQCDLWITGSASPLAEQKLKEWGVTLHQQVVKK